MNTFSGRQRDLETENTWFQIPRVFDFFFSRRKYMSIPYFTKGDKDFATQSRIAKNELSNKTNSLHTSKEAEKTQVLLQWPG